MKILAIFKQDENVGCDYTIGCGVKYYIFDAKSLDDAKKYNVFKQK